LNVNEDRPKLSAAERSVNFSDLKIVHKFGDVTSRDGLNDSRVCEINDF